MLGEFLDEDHQSSRAASLFDRAVEAGYREPRALLRRARMRADGDDPDGARKDALEVLQFENLSPPLVRDAVLLVGARSGGGHRGVEGSERRWARRSSSGSSTSLLVPWTKSKLQDLDRSILPFRERRWPLASPATGWGRAFDALLASIAGALRGDWGVSAGPSRCFAAKGASSATWTRRARSTTAWRCGAKPERSSRSRSCGSSTSNRRIRSETQARITCNAWRSRAGRPVISRRRSTSRTGRGEPYAGATARCSVAGVTAGFRQQSSWRISTRSRR